MFSSSRKSKRSLDVERLRRNPEAATVYSLNLSNRFAALCDLPEDVETAWYKTATTFPSAAEETIGYRRSCHQPWISVETLSVIDQKAEAHKCQDRAGRRRLQGIFRAKAKEDEERYFSQIADEIEDGLYRNDLRPAYRTVRRFHGFATTNNSAPVLRKDGNTCTSPDDILARWAEHYQEALNHKPATPDHDLDTQQMAAEDGIRDFCLSRGLGDVYKRQWRNHGSVARLYKLV